MARYREGETYFNWSYTAGSAKRTNDTDKRYCNSEKISGQYTIGDKERIKFRFAYRTIFGRPRQQGQRRRV